MAGRDYLVGPKHRFAHTEAYLRAVLAACGLAVLEDRPITVRFDEGQPVPGHLVIPRRD